MPLNLAATTWPYLSVEPLCPGPGGLTGAHPPHLERATGAASPPSPSLVGLCFPLLATRALQGGRL